MAYPLSIYNDMLVFSILIRGKSNIRQNRLHEINVQITCKVWIRNVATWSNVSLSFEISPSGLAYIFR